MLQYHYDVVVRNRAGNLVAVVEVKNPVNFDLEFASILRQDVLDHSHVETIPYLLVASQDIGYLWRNTSRAVADEPPTAQFSTADVLARYADAQDGRRMSGYEVSLRLQLWLNDLSYGLIGNEQEPERTLDSLGFLEAIRDGLVLGEVAA